MIYIPKSPEKKLFYNNAAPTETEAWKKIIPNMIFSTKLNSMHFTTQNIIKYLKERGWTTAKFKEELI